MCVWVGKRGRRGGGALGATLPGLPLRQAARRERGWAEGDGGMGWAGEGGRWLGVWVGAREGEGVGGRAAVRVGARERGGAVGEGGWVGGREGAVGGWSVWVRGSGRLQAVGHAQTSIGFLVVKRLLVVKKRLRWSNGF